MFYLSVFEGDEARELSSKVLTPLRTVTMHSSDESYHPPLVTPLMMPCTSPCQSPPNHLATSPSQDLRSMISLENKGHKRWLGEVIEVAEEAAAAAMRLSPRLSPHLKRDIYDFDENKVKSKQYLDATVRQVNIMTFFPFYSNNTNCFALTILFLFILM